MDIENYYNKLEELAIEVLKQNIATYDFLDNLIEVENQQIIELINFRSKFVDSKDQDKVWGYLCLGFFNQYTGIERSACFMITFEIDEKKTKISLKKRCELYQIDQPLFQKEPKLFEYIRTKENGTKDFELIDSEVFEQIHDSEILKYNDSYTYIDSALNPLIVVWIKENFKDKPLFIRVDSFNVFDKMPRQRVFESILMPANPNWWKNLSIHNRTKEGASYVLDDCSPKDNMNQHWEFHVKNIDRLEIIAKRNNNGNLSMMIEEITKINSYGLIRGKMIHLDTDNPFGTPFENSTLNHLDLAINIYEGDDAINRKKYNLANGIKTNDATYRTHIMRIENIPFKSLFGFVISFLDSQILIREWFEDQFE